MERTLPTFDYLWKFSFQKDTSPLEFDLMLLKYQYIVQRLIYFHGLFGYNLTTVLAGDNVSDSVK